MSLAHGLLLTTVALCLAASWPAHVHVRAAAYVDDFDEAHRAGRAANPPGLTLEVGTADGRATYVIGDLITLSLEFTGAGGERFEFDSRTYDRSGRLGIDRVRLTPVDGIVDPLHDYYRAMGFGFIGGGLSTPPAPLDGSRTLSIVVNEWVRIVRPGRYRLYVESHRFRDRDARTMQAAVPLTSNMLELVIGERAADKPGEDVELLPALRLRFADTPEAASELARRLLTAQDTSHVGTNGFHVRYGLLGTPHRAVALEVLRHELARRTGLVAEAVVDVAAFLDVILAHPRATPGAAEVSEDMEILKRRTEVYRCRQSAYRQQALAAGLRGEPADVARAVATFATAAEPPECSATAGPDIGRVLPPVFHLLTPPQQNDMLARRWALVAGPAMLPVLRALVDKPDEVSAALRDVALVRLGELAPDEAVRRSRQDVVSGAFRFSATALRVPDDGAGGFSREVTPVLLTWLQSDQARPRLQDGRGRDARGILPVIERFATAARADEVLASFPVLPAECAMRTTLVAYVLRSDASRGAALLRTLIDDPASRCGASILDDLSRWRPERLPESLLIEMLDHADRGLAASAARALSRMGGDAARQAMWQRLRTWHEQWTGRAEELTRRTPDPSDPVNGELALERALREGLLRAVRWRPTVDERLAVRDLCLTEPCRTEFSPFNRSDPPEVHITADESSGATIFRVDLVELGSVTAVAERLALVPDRTRIVWHPGTGNSAQRAASLYTELAAAAAARGLTIATARPAR